VSQPQFDPDKSLQPPSQNEYETDSIFTLALATTGDGLEQQSCSTSNPVTTDKRAAECLL